MSLLVDPEYFLHALRLNYLRRLPDPTGPTSIGFTNQLKNSTQNQNNIDQNPYLQLSGLTDSKRWPELLVPGSPPDPIINNQTSPQPHHQIRNRRRRNPQNDYQAQQNPSGSSLRYSETIVGPKGTGGGAGMRVSGRKSLRGSKVATSRVIEPIAGSSTNVGANALAITEGRTMVNPDGGINPEESDQEERRSERDPNQEPDLPPPPDPDEGQKKDHVRQTTADTVKEHRRRVSVVSFTQRERHLPILATIANAVTPSSLGRRGSGVFSRSRSHTIQSTSSMATSTMSSDMNEEGPRTLNLTTITTPNAREEEPSDHRDDDQNHKIGQAKVAEDDGSKLYYSQEHDPDKRLSDLLFNFRPVKSSRRKTIVGSVEYEPAPLLVEQEEEDEDETDDDDDDDAVTDIGTEQGSSSNLGEIEEEETKDEGGEGWSSHNDIDDDDDEDEDEDEDDDDGGASSVGKSLSNTIAASVMETNVSLNMDHHKQSLPSNATGLLEVLPPQPPQFSSNPNQTPSPPAVRRRERRRVNIKMGQLVGPPIIEEESVNGQVNVAEAVKHWNKLENKNIRPTAAPGGVSGNEITTNQTNPLNHRAASRNYLPASRPSLPDLRRAVKVQNHNGKVNTVNNHVMPDDKAQSSYKPDVQPLAQHQEPVKPKQQHQAHQPNASLSPGRARSLTTPTPIPTIAVESDESGMIGSHHNGIGEKKLETGFEPQIRYRSGSGPAIVQPTNSNNTTPTMNRRRRNIGQTDLGNYHNGSPKVGATVLPPLPPGTPTRLLNSNPNHTESQPNPSTSLVGPGGTTSGKLGSPSSSGRSKKNQQMFKKIDLSSTIQQNKKQMKSILTERLTATSTNPSHENPYRSLYSLLASKDRNAFKFTIYFPFSSEPSKPIKTSIRPDVNVEEVLGFSLWRYVEEGREPKIEEVLKRDHEEGEIGTQDWCLRLVEDDGIVDEDFPALERTRGIGKIGSNEFAIVMASEAQAKQNAIAQSQVQRRVSRILGEPSRSMKSLTVNPNNSSTTMNLLPLPINAITGLSGTTIENSQRVGGGLSGSLIHPGSGLPMTFTSGSIMGIPVYLKIRIPSPGKGVDSIMTTLNVSMEMYLADVLDTLCKKKGLGSAKDWALVVPATSIQQPKDIIVPLDRTVQSLQGVTSLALIKRGQTGTNKLISTDHLFHHHHTINTNPSASIFKRLSEPPQPKYVSINELTSNNRTFVVQTRRRGILGKQERVLSIEDDYVHIGPSLLAGTGGGGGGNGGGKTSSYHVSQIVDCVVRAQSGLKLVVARESGEKRYDVEAENARSAAEIVRHIKGLKDMYHTQK